MITKDLQALKLKFDQVMFNSLVFKWEINFEVTFGIFSVLVSQMFLKVIQISICFKIDYDKKECDSYDNLGL